MSKVVHSDPEILGGEPVFKGTRVPVTILFEHLEAGESIDVFLERISQCDEKTGSPPPQGIQSIRPCARVM